jgi:hypothetical protein
MEAPFSDQPVISNELQELRTETHDLSVAIASAAEALGTTGIAPSAELADRAKRYTERIQAAAGSDARSDLTLDDLSQILEARQSVDETETVLKLKALDQVVPTAAGYERL